MKCEEVKAVVSVGCCYNLLSEEGFNHVGSQCGFPMSCGVKSACFSLGKSSRDLACQVRPTVRAYVGSLITFFLPHFLSLFYLFCSWNNMEIQKESGFISSYQRIIALGPLGVPHTVKGMGLGCGEAFCISLIN